MCTNTSQNVKDQYIFTYTELHTQGRDSAKIKNTIRTIRQEVYIEIQKLKCLRTQVAENERPPM